MSLAFIDEISLSDSYFVEGTKVIYGESALSDDGFLTAADKLVSVSCSSFVHVNSFCEMEEKIDENIIEIKEIENEQRTIVTHMDGEEDMKLLADHQLQFLHSIWVTENVYGWFQVTQFSYLVTEQEVDKVFHDQIVSFDRGRGCVVKRMKADFSIGKSQQQCWAVARKYRQFGKLNIILVHILMHESPARRHSFVPGLVAAARTSETICENCMAILNLLSDEVFDLSRGEMTQHIREFRLIYESCLYELFASQEAELIRAILATLHAFLSWIFVGYIFESSLLEIVLKFFPVPTQCNMTLQYLTEVVALTFGDFYNEQHAKIYPIFIVQLHSILLSTTNLREAYANGASATPMVRNFHIVYIEMALDRVLKEEKQSIGPAFLTGISKLPLQYQEILLIITGNVAEHLSQVLFQINAALIAGIFHREEMPIQAVKGHLLKEDLRVRYKDVVDTGVFSYTQDIVS